MARRKSLQPGNYEIPRIPEKRAAAVLKTCDEFLSDSHEMLVHLRSIGIGTLLAALKDDIIYLALQPDSWGERMKARIISDIAPALQPAPSNQGGISVQDIAYYANILASCLLLELGRRKHFINIEFPSDPTNSFARFTLRVAPAYPFHEIVNRQLLDLVSKCGEDLVGVCYFGENACRSRIEKQLESISKAQHLKGLFTSGPKQ